LCEVSNPLGKVIGDKYELLPGAKRDKRECWSLALGVIENMDTAVGKVNVATPLAINSLL
jgi:hypothetical protein